MSSRSYSGLLLFENVFDFIPNGNPDFSNLGNSIFNPNLLVVESDCGTTLGKFEIVNFEAEGLVELSTGLVLTRERIEQLLSQGIYEVATHHTSVCISKGGICAKCYSATYPDRPVPKVLDRVNIYPEFLINAEVIALKAGTTLYTFNTPIESFDKEYIFSQGQLLKSGVDYHLTGNLLVLTQAPTEDKTAVMRCIQNSTSSFMVWLANTYSGSLLGMQPLPSQSLPVRSLLLSSLVSENRLQLISEYIKEVDSIPSEYSEYSDSIRDPLERALFMLALYCIYSNVIN
jgi:hypothetical protein